MTMQLWILEIIERFSTMVSLFEFPAGFWKVDVACYLCDLFKTSKFGILEFILSVLYTYIITVFKLCIITWKSFPLIPEAE